MKEPKPLSEQESRREALFARFRTQLGEYSTTGRMPEGTVQPIREELALQSGRLRTHGLTVETRLTPECGITYVNGIGCSMEGKGMVTLSSYSQGIHRRRTFLRDGKRLGRKTDEVCLAAALEEQENRAETRITEYYWWDSANVSHHWEQKFFRWYGILLGVPILLMALIAALAGGGLWGFFFVCCFFGLLMVIPLPFVGLVFLVIREAKKIRGMDYTQKHRKPGLELMNTLCGLNSSLTERYLEEVALTLSRRYMLQNSAFLDVLDTRYRGVICPLAVSQQPGGLEVTLELHVGSTLFDGKKLRDSREILRMTLWHEGTFGTEEPYTPEKFDRWTVRSLERRAG